MQHKNWRGWLGLLAWYVDIMEMAPILCRMKQVPTFFLFFYLLRTLSAIWCDSSDESPWIWKQNDLTEIHRVWNMRVLKVTLRLCWEKWKTAKWYQLVNSMKMGTNLIKIQTTSKRKFVTIVICGHCFHSSRDFNSFWICPPLCQSSFGMVAQ